MTLFTSYKKGLSVVVGICLSLILVQEQTFAQCPVKAKATATTIQCGDTIILGAIANAGDYLIQNDFNTTANQPGSDWATTVSGTFANPCGAPPASSAPTYLWFGDAADVPRNLTSKPFDLTTGGYISFDMRYAVQGDSGPCEGIDLPEEGVYVQFCVNGGAWVTIDYLGPNGGQDPFRTNWNKYSYTIPAAACRPNTQIRWIQIASSGQPNDHWGLDNINIVRNDPAFKFDWDHDLTDPSVTGATPPVAPHTDTTYYVTLYNSTTGVSCRDSVEINTITPTGTATATPAQICAGGTSQLNINPSFIPPLPATCGISQTGCQGISTKGDIGTGTVNNTNYAVLGRAGIGGCSSFTLNGACVGTCDNSARTQMIITAAELAAYFKGGQIYSLDLNAVLGGASTYDNFTILLSCTNKTEFTSNTDLVDTAGMALVYSPKSTQFMNGWNTILFDRAFDWNGLSNVLVQISWNSGGAFKNGNVLKTNTTNYSAIHAYSCGGLGATENGNATRYQSRPTMRLGICYRPLPVLSYAWTPATGLSSDIIKNPVATVPTTTEYTVVVSDSKRPKCKVTSKVTVSTAGPTVSISPKPVYICASGGSQVLTASGVPSTAGGTITSYVWSPAAGLSATTGASVTASPATTTTYTVTVTDNTGCTGTNTVTVFVNPATNSNPTNNGPLCAGQTLNLSTAINGATTYAWTGPNGFSSNLQNPSINNVTTAMAGTYTLNMTISGCTGTATTNVVINPKSDATFSYGSGSFCKTGSNPTPTVTTAGGVFSASAAGLVINAATGQIDLAASSLGNYTVTYSLSGTCPDSKSVPVSIVPSFNASFSYATPFCKGGSNPSPIFPAGASAGTFSSSPAGVVFVNVNSGEIDLAASTPGTNYVITNTIAAAGGCAPDVKTFTIDINPTADASFSGVTDGGKYCVNAGAQTLTASFVGGTFSGPGVSGNTFDPAVAGVGGPYTISYSLANGNCTDVKTKQVTVIGLPVVTISGNTSVCGGFGTSLTASPSGADSYLWDDRLNQSTQTANVFPNQDTTYTVTVVKDGCSASKSQLVTIKPSPSGTITGPDSLCLGAAGTLTASGGDSYDWTPTGDTGPSTLIDASTAGTINFSVIIINSTSGCTRTVTKNVRIDPLPSPTLANFADVCKTTPRFTLTGGSPTPGTYGGVGVVGNQFDPSVANLDTNIITYTYTDRHGCVNSATNDIVVHPVPATPAPSNTSPVCENGTVTLNANFTGTTIFSWTGPNGYTSSSRNPRITGAKTDQSGTYSLIITGPGNCNSLPGTTDVSINPSPVILITPTNDTICNGESLKLSGREINNLGIKNWNWTANSTETLNPKDKATVTVKPSTSTTYTVAVNSLFDCPGTAQTTVTVVDYPSVPSVIEMSTCSGDALALSGTGGTAGVSTYHWSPEFLFADANQKDQSVTFTELGTERLTVTVSNNDCSSDYPVDILVRDCSQKPVIHLPNAFSPNGDGSNESFVPLHRNLNTYTFRIFSRWGDEIFKSDIPDNGWDGKLKDKTEAPDGIYVYILNAKGLDGSAVTLKGIVTLVR